MDCDRPGRAIAQRIADQLAACASVRIVDLAPGQDDGYDLTAWLLDGANDAAGVGLDTLLKGGSDRGLWH
jgi:hypothetical protein